MIQHLEHLTDSSHTIRGHAFATIHRIAMLDSRSDARLHWALTWQKMPEWSSEQLQVPSWAQLPWPLQVSAAVQLLQGCRLHLRREAGEKPGHMLLSAGFPVASIHVTVLVEEPPTNCTGCPYLKARGNTLGLAACRCSPSISGHDLQMPFHFTTVSAE